MNFLIFFSQIAFKSNMLPLFKWVKYGQWSPIFCHKIGKTYSIWIGKHTRDKDKEEHHIYKTKIWFYIHKTCSKRINPNQ